MTGKRYALSEMEFDEISLVPVGDNGPAKVVIAKADPGLDDGSDVSGTLPAPDKEEPVPGKKNNETEENGSPISKDVRDSLPEEVVEWIDELEESVGDLGSDLEEQKSVVKSLTEERDTLKAELAKANGDDNEQVDLSKLDPELRSIIEKSQEDAKAAREEAAELRKEAERKTYISKAEAVESIPGSVDEIADVIEKAYSVDDAHGKTVERILKSANALIEKGGVLSKEIGRRGAATTTGSAVEAKAKELMKSDPTLTQEQAELQVYEQNPDLYENDEENV